MGDMRSEGGIARIKRCMVWIGERVIQAGDASIIILEAVRVEIRETRITGDGWRRFRRRTGGGNRLGEGVG